jgi:hypothetical protein
MAKDDVEETEQDEGEEEEEEERSPPKVKPKKRGPRNTFSTRSHGSPGGPNLYPRGTPVDSRGVPLEDVDLDRATVDRIGGYDAESARLNEQSMRVLARKARGEANVKWNSDAHTRYWEVRRAHPRARIALTQEFPAQDDGLASVTFSICPSYDDLKQHVREKYWRGNRAIYAWRIYEDNYSNLAVGRFEFAENLDWEPSGRRDPQPQQPPQAPQQQNPYGQFGFQIPGMPPMFFQPQQQLAQPVATPPVPPGTDPMIAMVLQMNAQLMNAILAANGDSSALRAHLAQIPALIDQRVKETAPPPVAAPPAPPPPTPIEQMQQASELIQTFTRASRQIANALGPNPQVGPDEPAPANGEDDFPIQVRKVGMFNVAAQDGKLVDSAFMHAAVNAGPVLNMVSEALKGLSNNRKEAAELEIRKLEAEEKREQQKLKNLREAAELKSMLDGRPLQMRTTPEPPSNSWQPPQQPESAPWADDPPPVEPKPQV